LLDTRIIQTDFNLEAVDAKATRGLSREKLACFAASVVFGIALAGFLASPAETLLPHPPITGTPPPPSASHSRHDRLAIHRYPLR